MYSLIIDDVVTYHKKYIFKLLVIHINNNFINYIFLTKLIYIYIYYNLIFNCESNEMLSGLTEIILHFFSYIFFYSTTSIVLF